MVSGNLLIGRNLSMEGFIQYVQSALEKEGYSINDKASVYNNGEKAVLTSVVGKGNLEIEVSKALVQVGQLLEKEQKKANQIGIKPIAYSYQVSQFSHHEGEKMTSVNKGRFDVLGIYKDDETASKLFAPFAQQYLLENLQAKAEEVEEQISELLDQKLSDL